jgi:hypothetical protein
MMQLVSKDFNQEIFLRFWTCFSKTVTSDDDSAMVIASVMSEALKSDKLELASQMCNILIEVSSHHLLSETCAVTPLQKIGIGEDNFPTSWPLLCNFAYYVKYFSSLSHSNLALERQV